MKGTRIFSFMWKILPILLNTKIKTRSYFLTRKFSFNQISKGNFKNCVFCSGNLNKNWEIISNLTCKMKNNKRTYLQNNFGRSNLYFLNFFHHLNKKKIEWRSKNVACFAFVCGFSAEKPNETNKNDLFTCKSVGSLIVFSVVCAIYSRSYQFRCVWVSKYVCYQDKGVDKETQPYNVFAVVIGFSLTLYTISDYSCAQMRCVLSFWNWNEGIFSA